MSRRIQTRAGWKTRLLLATIAAAAILSYSERSAPGAGGSQPLAEFFLPQFGHGGDPTSLSFSTTISLINLSTTTSQVSVLSLGPNGETTALLRNPVNGEPSPSISVQIPANGTASVESASSDPSQIHTGSLRIFSFNDRVVAQTEFSIVSQGNLAARAQVPGRQLRQRGSFPIGQQGRTGLAVLNPFTNDVPADVLLASVDAAGNVTDMGSVELMPGQQISRFLEELMNVEGATSAEFSSNVPVAILPLQQDGLVLTTQDLFPPRNVQSLFGDD